MHLWQSFNKGDTNVLVATCIAEEGLDIDEVDKTLDILPDLTSLLYSTLLHSTLLYSTLLYSTLLYSTLLYSTLLYSTLLYSTLLYSTLLYSSFLTSPSFLPVHH
jgi:Helicase conserved C-terminal domain